MTKTCEHCSNDYEAARRDSRYCSPRCRSAAHVRRQQGLTALDGVTLEPGDVEVALRNYLAAMYLDDDPLAEAALSLARRLDRNGDTLSGMSSALRALDTVVTRLRPPAVDGADTVDVLRFLRAVRVVDRDASAAIKALLTPEILHAMREAKLKTYPSTRIETVRDVEPMETR
jgi:hypothetical protein